MAQFDKHVNITDSRHILITDIGSTTTKALLISRNADRYDFSAIAKSPTTVEKPFEDVKIGLLRAVKSIETETGIELIRDNKISVPYLTTSSAGGGLQILVFGNSAIETGRIAQMTANGAGGVILRTLTIDDQILAVDKMRFIQELNPDLVLMAGGVDGGAISGVVRLAELLTIADPDPKFGSSERIPLVFCGNKDARDYVTGTLKENFDLHIVDNVRPDFNTLNLTPAREKIHDLFMENVMERAPGYDGLKKWVSADILPTPVGVEKIQKLYSEKLGKNVMIVDMGGATTDIFSNIAGDYYRTVAANIGMSYSVSNILKEAGTERIMRHLPEDYSERDVRDYIANKTLNPTYVPTNNTENLVEHATAIEGLKVALLQHQEMNFRVAKLSRRDRLKKLLNSNQFEDVLITPADKLFQLSEIDLIIGVGGIFAHVESPSEAFWMLVEGFNPRGVVKLAIDSSFSIPHMGVFASIDPDSALELFIKECLMELGYIVAPTGKIKPGKTVLTVRDKNTGR
ncbi:glutamate mutase L, partial [bacterium]|nr:glutamate mutase L [bacterium]